MVSNMRHRAPLQWTLPHLLGRAEGRDSGGTKISRTASPRLLFRLCLNIIACKSFTPRKMSLRPEPRADRRKKGFKKGLDPEDARRKREDNIIELRKSKRDESLQKKRNLSLGMAAHYMEDSTRSGVAGQRVGFMSLCFTLLILASCGVLTWFSLSLQLDSLPAMVQGVWSDDQNQQIEATTQFRKLLSIGKNLRARMETLSLCL